MTVKVAINDNLSAPSKQGAVGGLFTGEMLTTIHVMWYMASPSAVRSQETKILPSTKRIMLTIKDSINKATRITVFTAITGHTTPNSITTLKSTNPGLFNEWGTVLFTEVLLHEIAHS